MIDSILQDELLTEAGLRNERLLQHRALVERLLPFDPSEPGLAGPPRSPALCPALVWSLKRADVPRGAFILPDWGWQESRPFGTVESNEKYTADYFDSPRRFSRQDTALYSQTYQHLFDLDSASRIDLESREWIVFNAVPGVRSSAYFVSSMKPKLGAAIHRAAFEVWSWLVNRLALKEIVLCGNWQSYVARLVRAACPDTRVNEVPHPCTMIFKKAMAELRSR